MKRRPREVRADESWCRRLRIGNVSWRTTASNRASELVHHRLRRRFDETSGAQSGKQATCRRSVSRYGRIDVLCLVVQAQRVNIWSRLETVWIVFSARDENTTTIMLSLPHLFDWLRKASTLPLSVVMVLVVVSLTDAHINIIPKTRLSNVFVSFVGKPSCYRGQESS